MTFLHVSYDDLYENVCESSEKSDDDENDIGNDETDLGLSSEMSSGGPLVSASIASSAKTSSIISAKKFTATITATPIETTITRGRKI